MARWPDHGPPGTTNDEGICHVDLLATCAALVGTNLASNAGEDSYNILPALLGQPAAAPIREATVLRSGNGKFAIRQGDWMLVTASSGDGNRQRPWFRAGLFKLARSIPPANSPGNFTVCAMTSHNDNR
jgi:arylsulfatase A-like enzyme